jgi:hypothetical protein
LAAQEDEEDDEEEDVLDLVDEWLSSSTITSECVASPLNGVGPRRSGVRDPQLAQLERVLRTIIRKVVERTRAQLSAEYRLRSRLMTRLCDDMANAIRLAAQAEQERAADLVQSRGRLTGTLSACVVQPVAAASSSTALGHPLEEVSEAPGVATAAQRIVVGKVGIFSASASNSSAAGSPTRWADQLGVLFSVLVILLFSYWLGQLLGTRFFAAERTLPTFRWPT